MKKHLMIATGLAVLSTSAFASKARMTALNQSSDFGSFYLEDNRNAFRSSNSVNSMSNYIITEWGTNQVPTVSAATAEGGMFKTSGSLNYGLYLNSSVYGNAASLTATQVDTARFDVFVGGDAGLNWGLRFGYESNENGDDNESSGMDLGLSGTVAGANVWLNYVMPVTTKQNGADLTEQNADMRLGATYGMGDYTLFAEYASEGNSGDNDASTSIQVGLGKSWETSNGATLFYDASVVSMSNWDIGEAGYAADESKLKVPLTFGVEVKAASWLTWRASIQQSVYGAHEDAAGNATSGRTTNLGAGASLTWGDLQLDGVLAFESAAAAGDQDQLGTDSQFMTSVAAMYRF